MCKGLGLHISVRYFSYDADPIFQPFTLNFVLLSFVLAAYVLHSYRVSWKGEGGQGASAGGKGIEAWMASDIFNARRRRNFISISTEVGNV